MTAANAKPLDVSMQISNVLGTLGYMPAIAIRALAERNFDTLSYHRSSVLKHHGLPGRRKAQKMLAVNLRRQVRSLKAETIEQTAGEGFGVGLSGQTEWGGFLKNLEEGAEIKASSPMAIPFMRPTRFRQLLAAGKLKMISGGRLVEETKGRGQARLGAKSVLWGMLHMRRRQRRLLSYYAQWDLVMAKVLPRYDRDLDLVLTEAGRARIERKLNADAAGRAAARSEMARFLGENPGKHAEARRAAAAVASQVRKFALAPPGGRS